MRLFPIAAFCCIALAVDANAQQAGGLGQGNLLNPEITGFLDLGGSASTLEDNEAHNRFAFREAELDLRAAVTPRADGALILAVHEEIEEPFGDVEINHEFEIEEGYLNIHTLPWGLAAKGGKFRAAFGRNNLLHTHDLPQVTRPLAVASFLGHEGLVAVGGELSWIVPNPWDHYVEWATVVLNADGGEESPLLRGPGAKNPAVLTHVKMFRDVGSTGSIELGASYLFSRSTGRFDASHLLGADVTMLWKDPRQPDSRGLLLQGEFYWADGDSADRDADPVSQKSLGGYAFAQFQFLRNWYAGVRYDYTDVLDLEERRKGDSDWGISSILSWYASEALRVRLELQHLDRELAGRRDTEQVALVGVTFYIGAHPPHPYWVNR